MTMHDHSGHTHTTGHSHNTGYADGGPAAGMTILVTGAILLLVLLAFLFIWTPWGSTDGSTGGGQGGSDEPQQQEQIQPRAPEQTAPQVPVQPNGGGQPQVPSTP